jgi:hypothetical protein
MKKSRKKCYKDSNIGNKYSSKLMHFRCHERGHYASQCSLKNKGNGVKKIATRTIDGVEEDPSHFENAISMASCLKYNIVSSLGWYVENGAPIHTTYNISLFNKF